MKQHIGIIFSPDAQADLIGRIDRMDLGKLEPWHAFILALLSDATKWRDYDGDGSEFDREQATCAHCGGDGVVPGFWLGTSKTCPACHGKGRR